MALLITRRVAVRLLSSPVPRTFTTSTFSSRLRLPSRPSAVVYLRPSPSSSTSRPYSTRRAADLFAEELQDLYAEAKDEFEIATESTDENVSYAQEDREAAREYLDKLTARWQEILAEGGESAEDLKKRPIGQRIRELEAGVKELERRGIEEH